MDTTGNTTTAGDLTIPQRLIVAAVGLPDTFTSAMLAVAAWKLYPKTFGLEGFADDYPDNNKVNASIMGKRGLARKGWLLKAGNKLYQLSRQGKQEAARINGELMNNGTEVPTNVRRALTKIGADRRTGLVLQRMLTSAAYRRYVGGQKTMIGYPDVFAFWGVKADARCKASDEALQLGLKEVVAAFTDAENALVGEEITLPNSSVVDIPRLNRLREVHKYLENTHLDRIKRHCVV